MLPTTVDCIRFEVPTESKLEEESAVSDLDDEVERALTMEFLDEFQPLTMDCEEPLLTGLAAFSDDDPLWLSLGTISASVATSTAPEPAVWDSEILSL